MRRSLITLATAFVILTGCAALPVVTAIAAQRISVTAPSSIGYPKALTLKMDPSSAAVASMANTLLGALGGASVESKLNDVLRSQTETLRAQAAGALKQQLIDSKTFGSVVDSGGNVGFELAISRLGLSYSSATKSYQLVLDLEAKLTQPSVGVIWSGTRSMKDLSADTKALASKVDVAKLIAGTASYSDLAQNCTAELTGQLLDDLKAHPPVLRTFMKD
jgi:hypothetical protein